MLLWYYHADLVRLECIHDMIGYTLPTYLLLLLLLLPIRKYLNKEGSPRPSTDGDYGADPSSASVCCSKTRYTLACSLSRYAAISSCGDGRRAAREEEQQSPLQGQRKESTLAFMECGCVFVCLSMSCLSACYCPSPPFCLRPAVRNQVCGTPSPRRLGPIQS